MIREGGQGPSDPRPVRFGGCVLSLGFVGALYNKGQECQIKESEVQN